MPQKNEIPKLTDKNVEDDRPRRSKKSLKNEKFFSDKQSTLLGDNLDKKCIHEFPNPLVGIEYPGQIKNIDKAIRTLGGAKAITKAVNGESKLELKFHPDSQYAKGCVADKMPSLGLLVEVKEKRGSECSYEIINASNTSFKFNRMCDFQYEPLVTDDVPESKESEVQFVHHQILPNEIPSVAWLTKKSTKETPLFLTPSIFSKCDKPHLNFQSNSIESYLSLVRPDFSKYGYLNKAKRKGFIFQSYRFQCLKPDMEIPTAPNPLAMKLLKERRGWEKALHLITSLFNERPIWKKVAVLHRTKLTDDLIRFGLPCVGYYSIGGPFSTCWIKFGCNPTTDINLRIYQTLDFRMRSNGMQLKVKSRRALWKLSQNNSANISENQYILRPGTLPQARQMYYQYCDIHLPEIQDMFAKLPKYQDAINYDTKNGWLPINFTEQCREIVNKYILEAVQKELLIETKIYRQSEKLNNPVDNASSDIVSMYCNTMLGNVNKDQVSNEGNVEKIDLVEDNDDEQVNADEIVNILPETISDSEEESDSEMDVDLLNELGKTSFLENDKSDDVPPEKEA